MNGLGLSAFLFLVGVTVAGLVGSAMEIAAGRRLGFVEPYVCRQRVARSILAALAAGPLMLANDALAAWRERRVGLHALALAVFAAVLWCCATGIVVTEIALRMREQLG